MKKVCLFRFGGLGDLLVALPSIQLVRKKFPAAVVTLVCQKKYGMLLEKAAIVDGLIEADSPQALPLFSEILDREGDPARWLRQFDLILGWFSGKKEPAIETTMTSLCSGTCHFLSYDTQSQEQVSRFLFRRTLEAIGEKERSPFSFQECAWLRSSSGRTGIKTRLAMGEKKMAGKYAVVHPGSGSERKCWPLEKFLMVVEHMGRSGVCGALVTGEAEARMKEPLKKMHFPPGWSWLHLPSLLELWEHLKKADVYLGNDSGVTHFAAACGTEVLALFQKDSERAWKPFGRTHTLSAGTLEEISAEEVWRETGRLLHLP